MFFWLDYRTKSQATKIKALQVKISKYTSQLESRKKKQSLAGDEKDKFTTMDGVLNRAAKQVITVNLFIPLFCIQMNRYDY